MATNPKKIERISKGLSKKPPTPVGPPELKRYTLVIPEELFDEVQALAIAEHTTVQDIIRRSIRFALDAAKIGAEPGASIIVEHEGQPIRDRMMFYI